MPKESYCSYDEACQIIAALDICTAGQYRSRYKEHPGLPSNPPVFFAGKGWDCWYVFLNKAKPDLYESLSQAQAAARFLGVSTQQEYVARYKEDSRLPSDPVRYYDECKSWRHFFQDDYEKAYPTYEEAKSAARRLGVHNRKEYKNRYLADKKLRCNPNEVYAKTGWEGWGAFLSDELVAIYASYEEAKQATKKLGIVSVPDYRKRYYEDPRLPSSPEKAYSGRGWTNWYDFFDRQKSKFYPTYSEMEQAVHKLGITSKKEYLVRRKEDKKLPCAPWSEYASKGWVSWKFLFRFFKPLFYSDLAEASAAAKRLGIISASDYRAKYKLDTRLPCDPKSHFLPWPGWPNFLGVERDRNYKTYEEAKKAVANFGFKSYAEYRDGYKQDPRLPSAPYRAFKHKGWISIQDFLSLEIAPDYSDSYPCLCDVYEKYLRFQTNYAIRRMALRVLINGYFHELNLPDDPKFLLLRANKFNAALYISLIESQAESLRQQIHTSISTFFQWVLDEECTDVDGYESVVLNDFRNPFSSILAGFAKGLGYSKLGQTNKPSLGYEYILRARNYLVPDYEMSLSRRVSLSQLEHLQEFFDSRGDWLDVQFSKIDVDDPHTVWRKLERIERVVDGKPRRVVVYQVWSPVRFVALYTLLRFPLRGQQILWLDSGEADREVGVVDMETGTIEWRKNTGHLASRGTRNSTPQAAVQKGVNGYPKFYCTTNKTGARDKGYEVEWIPEDLAYWLLVLRDWQERYAPLDYPTPWTSIKTHTEVNSEILKSRGSQCFLFRQDKTGQPITTATAFQTTLPKLLYLIQRGGEDLARKNSQYGPRYLSDYTPHCLRVSLITAYIADGDAPIHIVSKLVGHAALVMTIHYVSLKEHQMRRPMQGAEKRAEYTACDDLVRNVLANGLQSQARNLIATDGNRIFFEKSSTKSANVIFDWGICPMSAAACNIGGDLIENVYAAVEAGYLGQKNCPRCRFFVSGIAFLGGLVSLANEMALEIHDESGRYQAYTAELDELESAWYDASIKDLSFDRELDRKRSVAQQQQSAAKLEVLLRDYGAVNRYVMDCVKAIDHTESENSEAELKLVVSEDLKEMSFRASESTYHLLSEICQNATIYRSANPSRALPLISEMIDRMAANNGLRPAMYKLTNAQKLAACNQLNSLLMSRLHSWERIDNLISGKLMILDVDEYQAGLTPITSEIKAIFSNYVSLTSGAHGDENDE